MPTYNFEKSGFGNLATTTTQRPLRRRFIEYSIEFNDSGGLELVDWYEEFDARTGHYEKKQTRASLPDGLARWLNPDSWRLWSSVCNKLRRDLDTHGLKIFFDRGKHENLRAKWRYRLQGKNRTDYMEISESPKTMNAYDQPPDQVPEWVIQLVQRNYEYYLTAEWQSWFGPKIQRKRESIIVDYLQRIISERQ